MSSRHWNKREQEVRKETIEEIEKLMTAIEQMNRYQSFVRKWMLLEEELNKLKEKRQLNQNIETKNQWEKR